MVESWWEVTKWIFVPRIQVLRYLRIKGDRGSSRFPRWMGGYEVPPPPPPGTPHNAILYSACLTKGNFLSLTHHHIHSSLVTSCLACSEKGHLQLFRLEVFKSFSTSTQKWTQLPSCFANQWHWSAVSAGKLWAMHPHLHLLMHNFTVFCIP